MLGAGSVGSQCTELTFHSFYSVDIFIFYFSVWFYTFYILQRILTARRWSKVLHSPIPFSLYTLQCFWALGCVTHINRAGDRFMVTHPTPVFSEIPRKKGQRRKCKTPRNTCISVRIYSVPGQGTTSIFPNPNTGVEVKWNEIKQREFDVIARKISSRSLSLNCYIVPIMMMTILEYTSWLSVWFPDKILCFVSNRLGKF